MSISIEIFLLLPDCAPFYSIKMISKPSVSSEICFWLQLCLFFYFTNTKIEIEKKFNECCKVFNQCWIEFKKNQNESYRLKFNSIQWMLNKWFFRNFTKIVYFFEAVEQCSCCNCAKRWQLAILANFGFLIVFGIRCNFGAAKNHMAHDYVDPWGKQHVSIEFFCFCFTWFTGLN